MQDKNKWFLIAAGCAVVVGISIVAAVSSSGGSDTSQKRKTIAVRSNTPALKESEIREHLQAAESYEAPNPNEKTIKTIESYRTRIENNPQDKDAPVLMESIGNLYAMRLGEFQTAAYYYEQVLNQYPDFNRRRIYVALVSALENAGDVEGTTRIYNEMMREFPEDSIEYKWAADKVGAERWEGPGVVRPGSEEEAAILKERRVGFEDDEEGETSEGEVEQLSEGEESSEGDTEPLEGEGEN